MRHEGKTLMITFEHDKDGEKLEIHTDLEGLRYLHSTLGQLIDASKSIGNEHLHLMTNDWGGNELSNQKQSKTNILINHVKVFCWND